MSSMTLSRLTEIARERQAAQQSVANLEADLPLREAEFVALNQEFDACRVRKEAAQRQEEEANARAIAEWSASAGADRGRGFAPSGPSSAAVAARETWERELAEEPRLLSTINAWGGQLTAWRKQLVDERVRIVQLDAEEAELLAALAAQSATSTSESLRASVDHFLARFRPKVPA